LLGPTFLQIFLLILTDPWRSHCYSSCKMQCCTWSPVQRDRHRSPMQGTRTAKTCLGQYDLQLLAMCSLSRGHNFLPQSCGWVRVSMVTTPSVVLKPSSISGTQIRRLPGPSHTSEMAPIVQQAFHVLPMLTTIQEPRC
jgi:hypothetical protein